MINLPRCVCEAAVVCEAVAKEPVPAPVSGPDDADGAREVVMPRPSVGPDQAGRCVAVADVVEERADADVALVADHEDAGREEHQRLEPPALVGEGEDHDRRGEYDRRVKAQPEAPLAGHGGGFIETLVRRGTRPPLAYGERCSPKTCDGG